MKRRILTLLLPFAVLGNEALAEPLPGKPDHQTTAGAAIGYCLSKHPFQNGLGGQFNSEGFELPNTLSLVGAVRRRYIFRRDERTDPIPANPTCEQACGELGKSTDRNAKGVSLKRIGINGVMASGLGDLGSRLVLDNGFVPGEKEVAGGTARSNGDYLDGDGSSKADATVLSDYCCCQLVSVPGQ